MATLDDPALAAPGVRGLFSFLVERLSDSFDPRYCALYDRLFAQVVDFCRRLPAGVALDRALRRFGLRDENDLLARKARLQAPRARRDWTGERVRKVLLLSRVTLGADVAVTSVCLDKAERCFPQAEMVLLAPATTAQLFRGDPRVRVRAVPYERAATCWRGSTPGWTCWRRWTTSRRAGLGGVSGHRPRLAADATGRLSGGGRRVALPLFREPRLPGGRAWRRSASWPPPGWTRRSGPGPRAAPRVALAAEDLAYGRELRRRLGGARLLVASTWAWAATSASGLGDAFELALLVRLIGGGLDRAPGQGRRPGGDGAC